MIGFWRLIWLINHMVNCTYYVQVLCMWKSLILSLIIELLLLMCFHFISGARPGSTGINKMCEGESIYLWTMEICDKNGDLSFCGGRGCYQMNKLHKSSANGKSRHWNFLLICRNLVSLELKLVPISMNGI